MSSSSQATILAMFKKLMSGEPFPPIESDEAQDFNRAIVNFRSQPKRVYQQFGAGCIDLLMERVQSDFAKRRISDKGDAA